PLASVAYASGSPHKLQRPSGRAGAAVRPPSVAAGAVARRARRYLALGAAGGGSTGTNSRR
ncbi:MAG TPA: hypothetical protein VLA44_03955, partial [Clostridia bacterium]|nr:hypothetical protein [Clostridia bacterium]